MEDFFFLTLPSNSSANVYPENRASHYRTRLAKNLELDHRWEVAVYECRVPVTWKNVVRGANTFTFTGDLEKERITQDIPTGYYDSLKKLIDAINEKSGPGARLELVNRNHFSVTRGRFQFHPRLGHILGTEPHQILKRSDRNPHDFERDIHHRSIYVYGDFIEPQMVGDSMSPLLCRMGVDNARRGSYLTYSPRHLSYLPVVGGLLHSPLIYLCDETGAEIRFQNGIVNILLHFRRRL